MAPPLLAPPVDDRAVLETHASGISWPAVIAGSVATASLCLILLSLGTGLGLAAVSPFGDRGASDEVVGAGSIIWLIAMQVAAGSLGGYLAGRLRGRWTTVHGDEVHFRDTAHGFLSWGLALIGTATFLVTASLAMAGAAVMSPATTAVTEGTTLDPNAYYVDMLFRGPAGTPAAHDQEARDEAGRIFAKAMAKGEVPTEDRTYLARLIAAQAGLGVADADTRIRTTFAASQRAVDAVRRATAQTLLWIFVAVLAGAFFSSLMATVGGRQRDRVLTV